MLFAPLILAYAHRGWRLILRAAPHVLGALSSITYIAGLALGAIGVALAIFHLFEAVDVGQMPDFTQWRVFIPAFAWIGASSLVSCASDFLLEARYKLAGGEQ